MRKYIENFTHDLYILKSDVIAMENGDVGIGHIRVPHAYKDNYELTSHYAFQPPLRINDNTFEVVFISK